MSLPPLPNWMPTALGLHQGALLLGALRKFVLPRQPLFLHLGLRVLPAGLTTEKLPTGGEVVLEYPTRSLRYDAPNGARVIWPLPGRTQAELFQALFTTLLEGELAHLVTGQGDVVEQVYQSYAARGIIAPHRNELLSQAIIEVDQATAGAYAAAFYTIFTSLARFRARLLGTMSPAVVWPEHFDLSSLWFVIHELNDWKPHLNFGFAPYSPGLAFPYLYTTAYPLPEDVTPPALPEGAYWHTEGWRGVVLPYAVIAAQADPAAFVEASYAAIFEALRPLLPASPTT